MTGEKKIKTTIPSTDKIQDKIDSWNDKLAAEGKPRIKITYEKGSDLMKVVWYFGPIILIILVMVMSEAYDGRRRWWRRHLQSGKSKALVFDKNNGTNVTFKDVAGLAEAKVEIEEIVEFLKNPQRYTELGAKDTQGALACRPPEPVRHCSRRPSPARLTFLSSACRALTLSRCLSAWAQRVSATCSSRPRRKAPTSSLSMRLMLWAVPVAQPEHGLER